MTDTFSSAEVARAAGMSHDNFRKQFANFHWRLFGNERPENGRAHQFNFDQALVYALARKLTECGFTAADAFSVSLFGLDQSSVNDYFDNKPRLFDNTKGDTYFIAYPKNGDIAAHGQFLFASELHGIEGLFLPYGIGPGKSAVEQFVVVNLTAIRDRVNAELTGEAADA